MIGRKFNFHDGEKGSALAVRISDDQGKIGIVKVLEDGTLVINFAGKSKDINQELIKFLARILNINEKRFDIVAGIEGSEKLISILDIAPDKIQELVLDKLV
jgi:uncharacterized protein YggU (UPF0235/DUF167 family)